MRRAPLLPAMWGYALRDPAIKAGLVLSAGVALVLVVVAVFYWRPLRLEQSALSERLATRRHAVVQAQQQRDLLAAYQTAAATVERIEAKLRAPLGQAALVDSLAQLAHRHDVRVVAEAYEEGRPVGNYRLIRADLGLEGRYADVRRLLGRLPELPAWAEVEELHIERARSRAGEVRAQLRLRVIQRAQPEAGA